MNIERLRRQQEDMMTNLRMCRLIRAHYWDLITGQKVKFNRECLQFTPEQTCRPCEQHVTARIETRA